MAAKSTQSTADVPVQGKRLIFIHVPKTAGKGILDQLRARLPRGHLKRGHPRRADKSSLADIADYKAVGGHINWHDLEQVAVPRVSFMVLRDGRERMASMYFFARANAERDARSGEPLNREQQAQLTLSPDDFFLRDDPGGRRQIAQRYNNLQAYYLATRRIRGLLTAAEQMPRNEVVPRAIANARLVDLVCTMDQLDQIEALLRREFDIDLPIVSHRSNEGPVPRGHSRFAKLCELITTRRARDRLEELCELDDALMRALFPEQRGGA